MLSNCYFRWLRARTRFSIRSYLILLVLIGMIPLLVFSTGMVIRLSRADRETFQRGATQRNFALMTAVDTELKGSIATLQALASSDYLDIDNVGDFRNDAARFLKSQPNWLNIHLAQPSGQQVVNLRLPLGTELGTVTEHTSFDNVVRTNNPVVGNLKLGRLTQEIDFTVRVPVVRDGILKYVLSAVVKPQSISALLARQNLPPDWIGVVLDGNRRFVARTTRPGQNLGGLASESFRAALDRAPEGWFRGTTIEGREVYTSYTRSPLSGWTVGTAIPIAAVDATLHRSLLYTILFGAAFLGAGIGLAWTLSTRSAGSIQELATMARDLGLGKKAAPPSDAAKNVTTRIVEIETLREAFLNAARLIQERSTERDQVEASLRRVSERLELAQEAANIGSFERDVETNAVEWSASMEKLFGISPGGFGGRYDDWRRLVHPDDIAGVESAVQNSIATGSPFDVEYRLGQSDGTVRWIASRGRIVADGPSRRIFGFNIDITERKRAEEELRHITTKLEILSESARLLLASEAPEQIVQTICEKVMNHLNCQMFFNYLTTAGDRMHLNAYAGISAETAKEIENISFGQAVCGCVTQDRSQIAAENILSTRGERAELVKSFGIRAYGCHPLVYRGDIIGTLSFATTCRDRFADEEIDMMRAVSDLAATAMARKRSEDALREADRRKDEFLAMLGHELRNPLNVISTSVELLRSQDAREAASAQLHEMITGQISHMVGLVDDLLDVSRITHGNIRLELKPCDLTALLRETVEQHRGLFDQSGLSLIAELPEEPLWVLGDRNRLQQVIGNGLQNANKFTDSGGTVTVNLTKAHGEAAAVLSIRDSGIGMDEQMLKRAFEPFSQAETGIRRSRGGLGLGLAVVKGLIDLHNGTVSLRSAGVGKGSELIIRLPLTDASPAKAESGTPAERMSHSYRILLIEDNVMGAKAMHLLLTRLGHQVHITHTGRDGIEAARRFDPQVVLCDIGLPDLDGFAVARALRRQPETTNVYLIALSGYGQAEYRDKALEAGFDVHLTKPVHINDLSKLLDRAAIPDAVTA